MKKQPVAPLGPVNYNSSIPPDLYRCGSCGIHGVKLWRDYSTFLSNQTLRCAACACKEQKKDPVRIVDGKMFVGDDRGDQIGWMVPAVPTEDGETYWGYTSVPGKGCVWWNNLPLVKE